MQIIRKLSEKKSCFKVSFFRSSIKGYFRDIQQIRSSHRSPRNTDELVLKIVIPYDPVPLSSLTLEERRSIMKSRWAIGPRPGSELKGRFLCKGFQASHLKG